MIGHEAARLQHQCARNLLLLYDIDIVCVLFPAIARARIKTDMRGNGLSRRYPKISKIILPHTFSIKLLTLITLILIIIS